MGLFEDIAVLDLKLRVVLGAIVLTFLAVSSSLLLVFESWSAFVVGALAALVVAYLTAKRLA